ncbi:MAG: outer membrane beta-barrel protein [Glaciecola sp.]|jgi:hypothetical protein
MRFLLIFLITIISYISVAQANELVHDDNSGWQLSLGLGFHNLSFDENYDNSESGIATSLQIGYVFKNDIFVYYENNVNFYNADTYSGDELFVNGISGLGARYNFSSTWYLSGLYGLAIDRALLPEYSDDEYNATGTGFGFSLGYKMSESFSIETNYMTFNLDKRETYYENSKIDVDGSALRVIGRYTF